MQKSYSFLYNSPPPFLHNIVEQCFSTGVPMKFFRPVAKYLQILKSMKNSPSFNVLRWSFLHLGMPTKLISLISCPKLKKVEKHCFRKKHCCSQHYLVIRLIGLQSNIKTLLTLSCCTNLTLERINVRSNVWTAKETICKMFSQIAI